MTIWNAIAKSRQAAEKWIDVVELLNQKVGEASREMIVYCNGLRYQH